MLFVSLGVFCCTRSSANRSNSPRIPSFRLASNFTSDMMRVPALTHTRALKTSGEPEVLMKQGSDHSSGLSQRRLIRESCTVRCVLRAALRRVRAAAKSAMPVGLFNMIELESRACIFFERGCRVFESRVFGLEFGRGTPLQIVAGRVHFRRSLEPHKKHKALEMLTNNTIPILHA